MFGDHLLFDSYSEKNAMKIFKRIDKKLLLKKPVISIGGISGTRKSETAHQLAEIFINNGKQCHIISGDDYYKTPWHIRNDVRKKNLDIIGPEEWDWQRLSWTFETFRNPVYSHVYISLLSKYSTGVIDSQIDKNSCDILIFEGLYACHLKIDAEVKVHIGDTNPESTFSFRHKRHKEDEDSDFRKSVVLRECQAIGELMSNATIIL